MSEHTPGPWCIATLRSSTRRYICDEVGNTIAAMDERDADSALEAKANARLIAAAPELLEALQYIAEHDPDKPGLHGEMIDVLRSAIAAARAAIAKAENRS